MATSYVVALDYWLRIAAVCLFIFLEILAVLWSVTFVDREWRKMLGLPPRTKALPEEPDGVDPERKDEDR